LQNARPELLQAALDVLTRAGATVTPTNQGIASRATAPAHAGRCDDGAVPEFPPIPRPSSWR